jgi:hypothetical protein
MSNFTSQFKKIEKRISPEYILKKNPAMRKKAAEIKRAVTRAGMAGAKEMRRVILEDSSTGSIWHSRRNAFRAKYRPAIGTEGVRNQDGSRIETGNMYNSVSYKRGKAVADSDRRRRQGVTGGFGWPATEGGEIKNAPSSPISKSRNPDTPNWRSDPRYFAMQEYGFGSTEGMNSQRKAAREALRVLREELAKVGVK